MTLTGDPPSESLWLSKRITLLQDAIQRYDTLELEYPADWPAELARHTTRAQELLNSPRYNRPLYSSPLQVPPMPGSVADLYQRLPPPQKRRRR